LLLLLLVLLLLVLVLVKLLLMRLQLHVCHRLLVSCVPLLVWRMAVVLRLLKRVRLGVRTVPGEGRGGLRRQLPPARV
jgi:hypothetical protein